MYFSYRSNKTKQNNLYDSVSSLLPRIIFPWTINHLKKLDPKLENGTYVIDPDVDGGVPPYNVTCDMTDKNGVGVTFVSHNSEERILVDECDGKGVIHLIFNTSEQVFLRWGSSPEFPNTVNSLSSMSAYTQGCSRAIMPGGCHVLLLK